jgi:hypothetical protein
MPPRLRLFRFSLRAPVLAVLAASTVAGSLWAVAPARAGERGESPPAAGSGLLASEAAWPRWQGRLALTFGRQDRLAGGPEDLRFGSEGRTLRSLSLLGDYYFTQQGLAPASRYSGGFRASGGLIVGSRDTAQPSLLPLGRPGLSSGFSAERRNFGLSTPPSALDGSDASIHSVPYLGIGYTGLQTLKGTGGGWGFSADVGVMALQPRSAVRLGQQEFADTVRELEISPLLQVGVSYSF